MSESEELISGKLFAYVVTLALAGQSDKLTSEPLAMLRWNSLVGTLRETL